MDFQRYAESLRARLHGGEVSRPMVIGVAVILLVAAVAAVVHFGGSLAGPAFEVERAQASDGAQEEAPAAPVQVAVYVSGQVASPGLYYLDEGKRVADAVDAAGGFVEGAAQGQLNLARVLVDGEQIDVPSQEAVEAAASTASSTTAASSASASSGRININTADAAALQTLDGIGQATAAKIIADREANGPFKTIEDLKRVSGIGDKKLAGLKDFICV